MITKSLARNNANWCMAAKIQKYDVESRLEYSLACRDQVAVTRSLTAPDRIGSKVVWRLSDNVLRFAINSSGGIIQLCFAIYSYIKLGLAATWELSVDICDGYKLPPSLTSLCSKPDIVVWNTSTKRIFFLELTVAFDNNLENAKERKLHRYSYLQSQCIKCQRYATVHTIDVGSRGIVDASCFDIIKRFTGDAFCPVTGLLFKICIVAITTSYTIWVKRNTTSWEERPLFS